VFLSDVFENFDNKWRARETYDVVSPAEFIETFELAPPHRAFKIYQLFCENARHAEHIDITLASMEQPIDRLPQAHLYYDCRWERCISAVASANPGRALLGSRSPFPY